MNRFCLATAIVAALLVAGCGGSGDDDGALTVYSGRAEKLVGPLLKEYERDTGTKLEVRYGESAELAATLAEEGDASPADAFFSQDAGALGAVAEAGLLRELPPLPVPARFRDPGGRWVGTSGRARVVAYSTKRLKESELPDSVFGFCDDRWKGRIGFAPPNASFQAFISGMRLTVGDDRAREWLRCMKRLGPTLLENNIQTEEAIAAGEIDVGFVNHYYLYELRAEHDGDFPVDNHFLRRGDPGSLVNVAGVGALSEKGVEFARWLLSDRAQKYFATKTFEYPLTGRQSPPPGMPALDDIHGPDIRLGDLGGKLRSTLEMLDDVGLAG